MGFLPKAKPNTDTTRTHNNRGMGFLLVFFPEDNTHTPTTIATKKANLLSSPSSTSSSFKRTTNSNALLSKAQSTISMCFLLLFTTLLLFTLSTFEPTPHHRSKASNPHSASNGVVPFPSTALQRMGTLYRRGTRAMNDIVVCHVTEDTTEEELRLFLRLLHRSGLTSKSDVVFIFASSSTRFAFAAIVREENDSFLSLVTLHAELNSTRWSRSPAESSFDVTRFLKAPKRESRSGGREFEAIIVAPKASSLGRVTDRC
ncbi:hypothetical protein E2542_SST24891 [Spatholobus suberectus]|nr:hypothetical protein E2542_SST24891 [Spatholobus suberectus]